MEGGFPLGGTGVDFALMFEEIGDHGSVALGSGDVKTSPTVVTLFIGAYIPDRRRYQRGISDGILEGDISGDILEASKG